jgi:hypothetical protein
MEAALKNYWPKYVRRWRAVKMKYGFLVSEGEEEALREMEKK